MKRLFTAFSLFISTAVVGAPLYRTMSAVPHNDATVRVDGKLEPIVFEPAALRVTVTLQSGTNSSSHAWPSDWASNVRFAVTPDGHKTREMRAEVVRQENEQTRVDEKIVEHFVSAEFRLAEPLQHGQYILTVSYDGLTQSTPGPIRVVRGDETPEIRDWSLQRQVANANTWDEVKRLELARIEINPRNAAAWFALAAGAEQHEDYATTKGYYEKAMTLSREIGGPNSDETVRGVQRILELLPAYYADREHLVIVRENLGGSGTPTRIELRERKSADRGNAKQN